MTPHEPIKHEMIHRFGEAYHAFGMSHLMGYVVALLIFSPEPLSLDDITTELGRSKGPISQICRRLTDRGLIRKVWKPNSRKDYYEIQPEIFSRAFQNNFDLIKNNTQIARELLAQTNGTNDATLKMLGKRLVEMKRFYEMMEKHFQNFIDEWELEQSE